MEINQNSKTNKRLREGVLIITIAFSLFLLVSLASYSSNDPGWSHMISDAKASNIGGIIGAWFSDILFSIFGFIAYLFPFLLVYAAWINVVQESTNRKFISLRTLGFVLVLISGSNLTSLFLTSNVLPEGAGGILGHLVSDALIQVSNPFGAKLLMISLFLAGITLFSGFSWIKFADFLGKQILRIINRDPNPIKREPVILKKSSIKIEPMVMPAGETTAEKKPKEIKPIKNLLEPRKIRPKATNDSFQKPSLDLLDDATKMANAYSDEQLEQMAAEVELRLRDFGIESQVVAIHPGPIITRFELQLAAGTKVSKISILAKDLARSLSVTSVRVVEIIQGKSVIGLELPNAERELIRLKEIFASKQYQNSNVTLAIALGKDIAGHPVIVDLAKMPHILIAGTTGSGKSVGLNAFLLSLIYKYSPKELRFILIDPKMLELSIYEGIPYLLTPVVTDMKDAANALRWCIVEMEKRYKLMAALGVRNIIGYNTKVQEAKANGKPLYDPLVNEATPQEPKELAEFPNIVVLIDEFADMMIVVGKKVEELITRIAQKARAAGIHLILATQRPSVDVITGLIKANIPSRIAFQVSAKVDSRTILDQMGAEQLLGNGDMLYLPPGTAIPIRVHGAFVSDTEVHRVTEYLKSVSQPEYVESILQEIEISPTGDIINEGDDAEQDPLYDQAVQFVVEARRISTSSIQRRFKIGYNRAARIVDAMEIAGIVSPMESNGNREVLVSGIEE